jgi:hypothetical protein
MSSTLRYYNQIKPLTKLESLSTPSYKDNTLNGAVVPIPFSYHNGVLDINIQDDVPALIANGTTPIQTANMTYKAKEMGGTSTVFSLGPNLLAWVKNLVESINPPYGPGATFLGAEVQEGGVVTKAQLTADLNPANTITFAGSDASYSILADKPTGDQYVYGTTTNNYFTSWIFKTPVVIKIRKTGGSLANITYLTLYSNWTQV